MSDNNLGATGTIIAYIVAFFLNGLILYWLWNALLPTLFAFPCITYWQAVGMRILCAQFFDFPTKKD